VENLAERIAGLSPAKRALLERRLRAGDGKGQPAQPIPRRAGDGPAPLSFAQERIWFIEQLQPASPLYNVPAAMRLTGPLEVPALEAALNAMIVRHEVLRATFPMAGERPVQAISPFEPIRLPRLDLSALPASQREAEALRLAVAEAQQPFDLARGPLCRAALLRLSAQHHLLLLTTHHMVFDGWSMGIALRELAAFYQAHLAGAPPPLADLPIQYADFAIWQRQWVQGDVLTRELEYWKQQLAGSPSALALPTDRRPTQRTFHGARESLLIPAPIAQALRDLGRQQGATLFMALLAAFHILLHRYAGQEDIRVGVPVAGRTRTETEGLIGLFINTLVMRADLSGDPTFRELLGRVRGAALGAYAHQDLPFEKLVEELRPQRRLGENPLFQVIFQLRNMPGHAASAPGLRIEKFECDSGVAKVDLDLEVTEAAEGLRCALHYSTDLFGSAAMARMLGHFRALLEGIVRDPGQRISRFPLLSEEERRRVLVESNDTATAYPRDATLSEVFAAQARRSPDAPAVICAGRHVTYRELNRRANQLAHRLQALGVGPDTLVGVCLQRSTEMVVATLGIIKAGGAYLPLDPSYPRERLAIMLKPTAALVTQRPLLRHLPDCPAKVVCLDADRRALARERDQDPTSAATSTSLAYVMFTSGSTGAPKAVAVPHRAVIRLVMDTDYVQLTPADAVAQVSNTSFDASTFEIWGALLSGGRMVIIPTETVLSPREFAAELRRRRVTALFLTTALFNQIARELPDAFASLQHLLFGGEAVDPHWVREVLKHGPPGRLLHVYGPTESTAFATAYRVQGVPEDAASVPIGRPIANTRGYILDRHLQPAPIGVAGELHIAGEGLARGYLGDPEATAQAFIPDPFSQEPGDRLYKTGDLARWLPDGNIEFLGRLDLQVKIRGFRIEPAEVEAALSRHPGVREAVVIMREDTPGDKRLVAYIVRQPGRGSAPGDLRAFLQERLPDYMVPAAFVPLEALPLNPNAKVDRQALPPPAARPMEPGQRDHLPRDPLELQLAQLWEQVLGVRPIGVHDDFFELGGHSLLAVRLLALIEKHLGKRLPVAAIFQAPTVARLAHLLRQDGRALKWSCLVPIQTGGSRPPLFCVHPGGGSVLRYQRLARALGPDQPFYGLQEYGREKGQVPHSSIEEMAAHYLEEARSLQPRGPYFLGGYSFGGIVAFEMACQLRAQGQAVALLALLDTYGPSFGRSVTLRYRGRRLLQRLRGGNLLGIMPGLWRLGREQLVKAAYGCCRSLGRPFPPRLRSLGHFYFYRRITSDYRPRAYPGRITLLRGNPRDDELFDPLLWWGDLAAEGVEVHEVAGAHADIAVEPAITAVAQALRGCLERAQQLSGDDSLGSP
jgi:aspartate racemase